jgi:polysaccharide chain length determinant protein (PEP-CTERM system associated)
MNVESGIPIDLVGAVRRRAALISAVAGAVFLVAYWVAMALPNEYTSYATMLVEPPSVNEKLVESGVAERDINTRLNLMTAQILSRPRLSKLIDDFKLYDKESRELTRAEVVDLMRRAIQVVPVEGALVAAGGGRESEDVNTFQIYFTYRNLAMPQRIAQKLAQQFIDEHIQDRVEITQKSFEFVEAEQESLSRSIRDIERKIAQVKVANTGSLPENFGSNQQNLIFTVGDLRDAQQVLSSAQQDESFWSAQNISLNPEGNPNDVVSPSRRLQVLELSLAEYEAKGFTEKHPDVIAATQEVAAIRQTIEQSEAEAEAGERPMTFAQLSVQAEQRRAALRVQASRSEFQRLQGEVEEIQARASAIPQVAEQLDGLERQWRQLSSQLTDFENRRLRAFVQANLERRQLGEQFRILEPAAPPQGPSSPNRILILAIGVILGLVLGLGVGISIETIDSSVHAARELQSALSIPVLAAVPAILLESDRLARFKRRLRYSIAAAVVVFVSLAGGAVSYVVVNGTPGFLQSSGSDEPSTPEAELPGAESEQDNAGLAPFDRLLSSPEVELLASDGRG